MSHRYYEEDFDGENEQRLAYFDSWFMSYSKELARESGVTLGEFLSDIRNITSFKAKLAQVFSLDASLANYVSGMSHRSHQLFFARDIIQEIVQANKEKDGEFFEEIQKEIPVSVEQVEKEVVEFFKGEFIEKETGKVKKVIAKKEIVKVKGKDMVRHRDAKGRFVKKI